MKIVKSMQQPTHLLCQVLIPVILSAKSEGRTPGWIVREGAVEPGGVVRPHITLCKGGVCSLLFILYEGKSLEVVEDVYCKVRQLLKRKVP